MHDLKSIDLWDDVMVADLKYFDGSLAKIDRVPAEMRTLYATAFEVDATWIVEAGSRRQKWIDQAQSLNIYMAGASGKKLDEVYKLAWVRGLKTTYYLRTLAATSAEKSTGQGGELNAVSASGGIGAGASGNVGTGMTASNIGAGMAGAAAAKKAATAQSKQPVAETEPKFCAIDDPDVRGVPVGANVSEQAPMAASPTRDLTPADRYSLARPGLRQQGIGRSEGENARGGRNCPERAAPEDEARTRTGNRDVMESALDDRTDGARR